MKFNCDGFCKSIVLYGCSVTIINIIRTVCAGTSGKAPGIRLPQRRISKEGEMYMIKGGVNLHMRPEQMPRDDKTRDGMH